MNQKTLAIAFLIFISVMILLLGAIVVVLRKSTSPTSTENIRTIDYTIVMENFSYSPNQISGKPGETLTIKLVNKEGTHDFVIDELDVRSSTLFPTGEEIFEITIPEDASDSYEFYCSISGHRQMGMVGTLTIEQE